MVEFLLIALIILVSAFVQGFCGFAFSLVLIPLLGLFMPFHEIIVLNLLFSLVLNISVFIKLHKYAKIKELSVLIISAIIFTIIGAYFVKDMNDSLLKIVLGTLLIISSTANILNIKLVVKSYKKYYPFVGSLSGFLNGLSSIAGPPLLIYFSNTKMDKLTYKATFNAIFLSLNIVAIVSYLYFGYITVDILKTGSMYVIFVIIGAYVGLFVSSGFSEKTFKRIVTLVILLMGISMIVGELWK